MTKLFFLIILNCLLPWELLYEIGFKALAAVTNHPKLRDLPFYLETPNPDLAGYAEEIAALRRAHE